MPTARQGLPAPDSLPVVGYARLSSQEQAAGTVTLEQQVTRLEEAGAVEVLVEVVSARAKRRPQFEDLMRRVEGRQVARVIATRLDRLSRTASETVRLAEVFGRADAPALQLLDDPVDLSTIGGRLQLQLLGVVAAAEVDRLRERSIHGKRHRAALGRPDVTPFGLRTDEDGRLQADGAPFLCTIEERREWSRAEIGRELFGHLDGGGTDYSGWVLLREQWDLRWHRTAITRWASNPALRGAFVQGRVKNGAQGEWAAVREGAGEALIEPDRHRQYAARVRARRLKNDRSHDTRRKHTLTGHVFCVHCGQLMGRAVYSGVKPKFRCIEPGCPYRIPGERQNTVYESETMKAVLDRLRGSVDRIAHVVEGESTAAGQRSAQDAELTQLEAEREHLALEAGNKPWLAAALPQLEQRIADRRLLLEAQASRPDEALVQLRAAFYGLAAASDPRLQQLADAAIMWRDMEPDEAARLALEQERIDDDVEGSPVRRGLDAVLALPAEQWLHVGFRPLATLLVDRFVRRVEAAEKKVAAVELNLPVG